MSLEEKTQRIHAIDQWLPQTQCTQCSYPRCFDYASAIEDGEADINQCPPGGDITIRGLASLLGKIGKPLNPEFGEHRAKQIAVIDEDNCIGCVMCIKACPVDAIVGAAKQMHTVIERDCTGCELCLEPCPVDCIEMIDQSQDNQSQGNESKNNEFHWRWPDYSPEATERARQQTNAKIDREQARQKLLSSERKLRELRKQKGREQIQSDIAAALLRAQQKASND